MSETNESLLNVVNASGFLFQLGVQESIQNTYDEHRWRVVGSEHRWQENSSAREAFIDIVISNDNMFPLRMAIECKRVQGDAHWVFLLDQRNAQSSMTARTLWSFTEVREERQVTKMDWGNLFFEPMSFESSFCIVRGQNSNDRIMLDRIADILLPSLESLAIQEFQLLNPNARLPLQIYVPVVVTNAILQVCKFGAENINLNSGELQLGEVTFETVPYIRYTKGLTTTIASLNTSNTLQQVNIESERTLFIVNVQHLVNFLRRFKRDVGTATPPWHGTR